MKKISVVILTWNSAQYIVPCLDSVIASIEHLDYEILIVDNGSTDSSISLLNSFLSARIELIQNTENLGVAKSRNQALRKANAEYVLILDVDTVVNKAAIDAMIAYLDADKQTAVCAVKLQSDEGEVQMSCRKFPSIRYKVLNLLEARGIKVKANESQYYTNLIKGEKAFEVEYVIGACQMIRKTALDEVGLLDENIFYGPEDADFCYRMHQHNWKVIYLPFVNITHHYQQISNKRLLSRMSLIHTKALLYFFWKHRSI